jgi:hypothetical protein
MIEKVEIVCNLRQVVTKFHTALCRPPPRYFSMAQCYRPNYKQVAKYITIAQIICCLLNVEDGVDLVKFSSISDIHTSIYFLPMPIP